MSQPVGPFKPKVVCAALGLSRVTLNSWHTQKLLTWWKGGETDERKGREYTMEMAFGLALTKCLRDDGFPAAQTAYLVESILEMARNGAAPADFFWARINNNVVSGVNFQDKPDSEREFLLLDSESFHRLNVDRLYVALRTNLNRFASAHWAPELPGEDGD